MSIGENIKLYRKLRGITQKELSNISGISRSHIAAIEINQYNPSLDTLKLISNALDVKTSDLLGYENKNTKSSNTSENYKICNRLKLLRQKEERTIEDIASFIGETIPNIVMYENNIKQPNYNILKKLADFYNVSVDYLSGFSNTENPDLTREAENLLIISENYGKIKTLYEIDKYEIALIKDILNNFINNKQEK